MHKNLAKQKKFKEKNYFHLESNRDNLIYS